MESFFVSFKTECFYGREFNSREEIVDAVRDYLDYYNHRRIQLKVRYNIENNPLNNSLTFWGQIILTALFFYCNQFLVCIIS